MQDRIIHHVKFCVTSKNRKNEIENPEIWNATNIHNTLIFFCTHSDRLCRNAEKNRSKIILWSSKQNCL